MSKELEALNGLFDLVTCQGSFEKAQRCFDIVEEALHRLEAIDNAKPSEALELAEWLECDLQATNDLVTRTINGYDYLDILETIKQALLKAEKEHNSVNLLMQELDCKDFAELRKYARCGYEKINKHYLKWEDLEFDTEWKYQEVKLNGTKYTIKYKCDFDFFDNYYEVVKIYNQNERKQLFKLYNNKYFFNDLHLERVEE